MQPTETSHLQNLPKNPKKTEVGTCLSRFQLCKTTRSWDESLQVSSSKSSRVLGWLLLWRFSEKVLMALFVVPPPVVFLLGSLLERSLVVKIDSTYKKIMGFYRKRLLTSQWFVDLPKCITTFMFRRFQFCGKIHHIHRPHNFPKGILQEIVISNQPGKRNVILKSTGSGMGIRTPSLEGIQEDSYTTIRKEQLALIILLILQKSGKKSTVWICNYNSIYR